MNCGWKELMQILPSWLRGQVDGPYRNTLQELRLRTGKPVQVIFNGGQAWLSREVGEADLSFVVNTACRYSPWTAVGAASGYITAPGGHRIGLCGDAVIQGGQMTGLRSLRSLNIRVARDLPGIARSLEKCGGSLLIIGAPGTGKTTLLRDLVRQLSRRETVGVVDSRGELFPSCFDTGQAVDVLTGCQKAQGLDTLIRTMGPVTVAVDEITDAADCEALLRAGWCGVRLLATAHAIGKEDLYSRKIYRPLVETGLFDTLVVLKPDKSFRTERMGQ